MGTYTRLIGRLAPSEDAEHVEAWLRSEHGTIESIEPVRFAAAVKAAVARLHEVRPPQHHQGSTGRTGGR